MDNATDIKMVNILAGGMLDYLQCKGIGIKEGACTGYKCRLQHEYIQVGNDVDMSGKDASWVLTSAVIIFSMQTGKLSVTKLHLCFPYSEQHS